MVAPPVQIQGCEDAQNWWASLAPDEQQLIITTTWCTGCGKSRTMHDPHGEVVEDSGKVVRHSFLLKGSCAICGGKVARFVEGTP